MKKARKKKQIKKENFIEKQSVFLIKAMVFSLLFGGISFIVAYYLINDVPSIQEKIEVLEEEARKPIQKQKDPENFEDLVRGMFSAPNKLFNRSRTLMDIRDMNNIKQKAVKSTWIITSIGALLFLVLYIIIGFSVRHNKEKENLAIRAHNKKLKEQIVE